MVNRTLAALVVLLVAVVPAQANPIDVTFTTTGSPNNWTLDFDIANNLPSQSEYFFGVQLPARNIVGSPGAWNPNAIPSWSNAPYGGSSLLYNNNWIGSPVVPLGGSQSGFDVRVTTSSAPTTVPWFSYTFGDASDPSTFYNGPGCFHCGFNPGFEGVALGTAVPEPTTGLLVTTGLVGLLARRRRSRAA